MRLIRCYIENFGKLKNQDISFTDGAMCFHHENGWGKSTLAAFLTVMLYGFDNERSRDDYVNERKRYHPWQGGVYGGTLTFSVKGRAYTIERTFGMKEKEDHFLLRDAYTNLESQDFSSNLGEELFQLDRASFERTILLSQNDCAAKTTDRIQAKLGNLAEATDDVENYEKADRRLNDLLNNMSPARKTGSLYRLKEQISDLEAELQRQEVLEREIEQLFVEKRQTEEAYSKYKEIQEELMRQQRGISKTEQKELEEVPDHEAPEKTFLVWIILGIGCFVAGVFLNLVQIPALSKETGVVLCLAGMILLLIGIFQALRQRALVMGQIDEDVQEQSGSREEQLEEIHQRLRKIQAMIETAYRKKVHIEREIQDKTRKKERLLEKEEQLILLKEQYAADMLKYERLKMTRNYLAEAKAAYLTRYRNPIMQAFLAYFEMISGDSGESCRMDANLELSIQEYGCQHESRYYSAGWKDLMGICMRMALIEVMYKGEKPFLIMDDPFVNLDGKKTEEALAFVKAIGEDYQVLYFTCHESRIL